MSSQSGPPLVPESTSSKRKADLQNSINNDSASKERIDREIKASHKIIKVQRSLDASYWAVHKKVLDLQMNRNILVRKMSLNQFLLKEGDEVQWEEQDEAKTLQEEEYCLELKRKLLDDNIERTTSPEGDREKAHRKWIMELLTSYPSKREGMGLGNLAGHGQSDGSDQNSFRRKLEDVSRCNHPSKKVPYQWCAITSSWFHEGQMNAVHVFPYGAGSMAINELFGLPDEMFEPVNGIMMCKEAENLFIRGYMVLVPDVSDECTNAELDAWANAPVKDYRIRVLDAKRTEMRKQFMFASADMKTNYMKHWWEFDGQKVSFKSDFRPRARYLYWQFAVGLLKTAWQSKHREDSPVAKEFGKRFWGTKGSWIKKRHLLGFAEYLGHDINWEHLLEAAIEPETEDDNRPDPGGVAVATAQLDEARKRLGRSWNNEDEEDESSESEQSDDEEEDDSE